MGRVALGVSETRIGIQVACAVVSALPKTPFVSGYMATVRYSGDLSTVDVTFLPIIHPQLWETSPDATQKAADV